MDSKIANVPVRNRFAELLEEKQRKESRYISIGEVATATGVTRRTLYKWEQNNITQYDTKVIDALCAYFGVSFNDLLVHTMPEKKKPAK